MHPHGSDRVRVAGDRIILHSRLAKGWMPRVEKTGTHAEFPGTAVLWDEQYYEVLAADALPAGGVRYQLAPWRDDHTIRVFSIYDEASEAALLADYEAAARQRKRSRLASLSSMILGHLPQHAQDRLANELGLFPARMTMLSTLPCVALLGTCVWLYVDAKLRQVPSPVPVWLWLVALFMFGDSAVRFMVAMSQMRGIGSVPGTLLHGIYELATRKPGSAPPPPRPPGADDPERDRLDAIEMRTPLMTLLRPAEQHFLAQRYGFDYRKDGPAVAWSILGVGVVGLVVSAPKLGTGSGTLSFLIAALMVLEQLLRIRAMKHGPAGSVWGALARPFVRSLLRDAPAGSRKARN